MGSSQGSTAPRPALAESRHYSDIQRWTSTYASHCEGCNGTPEFVLKDNEGNALVLCANCLTETFRKDPEMTGRVLRAVADRL